MFFCVCWVDKTTVTHNDNSGQALLSPCRIDGSGTFARVHEWWERTNSMHRNSKREAFVATLAVYTYYKVQSLLSLGVRQNQSFFCKGRKRKCFLLRKWYFSCQCIYSGRPMRPKDVDTTSLVPCSGRIRMAEITHKWNTNPIKQKQKQKKKQSVCGESSPHSKYDETIHYFPLKSFPIFQLASLLSLFLLLFHVCILKICQRHPMTSYSHCRAEWNTLRRTSPWKILERREEERERDLRSSRLGCRCVQQKDEKQLTSPEWKKTT